MYLTNHFIPTHNTEIGAGLMKIAPVKVLWLTHRGNLLYQTRDRLAARLNEDIGVVHRNAMDIKRVTVGMVQTLFNRVTSKNKEIKAMFKDWLWNEVDMLLIDECLDGDTEVAVPEGIKLIKELRPGDEVLTPTGQAKVKRIWKVRNSAFRYSAGPSNFLIASRDHRMPVIENRGLKEAQIGAAGKLLLPRVIIRRLPYDKDEYMLGWILGDGHRAGNSITFGFTKDVDRIAEIFSNYPVRRRNYKTSTVFTLENEYGKELIRRYDIPKGNKAGIAEIPEALYRKCSVGVIKGLFDAEGYRGDGNRIGLDMKSEKCVRQLSGMLISLGIHNSVSRLKRTTAPQYGDRIRLSIYGEYINMFMRLIGFEIDRKQGFGYVSKVSARSLYKEVRITNREFLGIRELYDFEIDDNKHLFYANGFLSYQCHHQSAATWFKVSKNINAFYRFGLSATPLMREEIQNLRLISMTGEEIKTITNREMIMRGFSAAPKIYRIKNFSLKFMRARNWQAAYIAGIELNNDRNNIIAGIARLHKLRKEPVLILIQTFRHARELLSRMTNGTILVSGLTEAQERNQKLAMLERNEIPAIVATPIFDEGMDLPAIKVLILAGAGKSHMKLLQRIGRGMRKKPSGENVVRIYDFEDRGDRYLEAHSVYRLSLYRKEGFDVIPTQIKTRGR
jgi:superfamily II DNA or RNA helicase